MFSRVDSLSLVFSSRILIRKHLPSTCILVQHNRYLFYTPTVIYNSLEALVPPQYPSSTGFLQIRSLPSPAWLLILTGPLLPLENPGLKVWERNSSLPPLFCHLRRKWRREVCYYPHVEMHVYSTGSLRLTGYSRRATPLLVPSRAQGIGCQGFTWAFNAVLVLVAIISGDLFPILIKPSLDAHGIQMVALAIVAGVLDILMIALCIGTSKSHYVMYLYWYLSVTLLLPDSILLSIMFIRRRYGRYHVSNFNLHSARDCC